MHWQDTVTRDQAEAIIFAAEVSLYAWHFCDGNRFRNNIFIRMEENEAFETFERSVFDHTAGEIDRSLMCE